MISALLPFVFSSLLATAAEKQSGKTLENYLKRLGYESLPLSLNQEQNHLFTEGRLNGEVGRFLIDTGWSVTTVDRRLAKNLKTLKESGLKIEDSYLGTLEGSSLVVLESLKLGGAEFLNQPAMVRSLQMGGRHMDEEGVLGGDFLFRNFCLLDCAERRLYVRGEKLPPRGRAALEETLHRGGFAAIALEQHSLALVCKARVNGKEAKLLVDTGAVWSVFDQRLLKRFGLATRETGYGISGVGKIGTHHLKVTRVRTLDLGNLTGHNVDFGIADMSSWGLGESEKSLSDVDGLLGTDQLAMLGALIDCRGHKLWLRPVKK